MKERENVMPFRFDTLAVREKTDPATGAVVPPLHLSTTFAQSAPAEHAGYEYSRSGNPTRAQLEEKLASLEGGTHGLCFASGMAATSAVLSLLRPGDRIIASADLYGGTYRLFDQVLKPFGLEFTYTDTSDVTNITLGERTRLVWLETPTNPLLQLTDIARVAQQLREAKRDVLLVVDNTFATPRLQRPLELGADIVVHSTTKYLGGHCDVVGGAVVTSDEELYRSLAFVQNAVGAVPSPFDCFLLLRGLKTLSLRMERHCANAARLARFLEAHPRVARVYYPGLPGHTAHALAGRQMADYGGMVSFELRGNVRSFLRELRVFTLAESLGGVESLVCHPATMTHAAIPEAARVERGFTERLLRLSVGIEDYADLEADVERALYRSEEG